MKIGYAVLTNDEDINTSEKLGFAKVIQLDRMYIDFGDTRDEQEKMIHNIKPGNAVIFQSPDNCGMDYEEQIRLREQIISKTTDVMYFSGDNIPEIHKTMFYYDDISDETDSSAEVNILPKKRGRKAKPIDQNEFDHLVYLMNKKQMTKKEVCAKLGITYPTLMRKLAEAANFN